MSMDTIYQLNWQYDYWADIENCFPKGCKVTAVVKSVMPNYAFLITTEGITCFLDKRKVNSLWVVKDLTEKIRQGESFDCTVIDYNYEKKSLTVSLNLN